jgi:archaeal flagellar protein FlaJ
MIDTVKRNIDVEIEMLREISACIRRLDYTRASIEKKQLIEAMSSLQSGIKLLNDAVPELLEIADIGNKLPSKNKPSNLENVYYKRVDSEVLVGLKIADKDKFLKEISVTESLLKKIKKRPIEQTEKFAEFKAARGYLKLSNYIYLDLAVKYINKGYFKGLYQDLKKANIDILFESYVAMMFFSSTIFLGIGILLSMFLMFFNIGLNYPFISIFEGNYFYRILQVAWIIVIAPLLTFVTIYVYPSTEKNTLAKRIESELPFAVIHMSAISGSGIPPSEIFRIIGLSKEYPFLRREFRKIINQTNIYGYDLVTALDNVSKSTPSQKLSEVFNGIATTISSGGSLSEFFEKRAETLLTGYRLERERFIKIAETFMDIYISVVIATPMILMLLLVMMSISGFSTQLSPLLIGVIISLIVVLINVLFITFLHIKQPAY